MRTCLGNIIRKKKVSHACIHERLSALLWNVEKNLLPNCNNIWLRAHKIMLKERREDYYYSWSKQKPLQSTVGHVIWDKPKIRIN